MKQKTRIIIYIAIAVTVLVSGILAVLSSSQGAAEKAQKFIDLGNKYLIELSYDKAVIEFNKAIEIEPKNADAYIGLAEAYIGLGDTDSAVDALKRGYDLTGDERIKDILEELLVVAAETSINTSVATTTELATTTISTETTEMTIEERTVFEDSIEITDIVCRDLESYLFEVTVKYNLYSSSKGEINVGFPRKNESGYNILAKSIVDEGTGELTLNVTASSNHRLDKCYANLSEYPHENSWTPLVSTSRVVTDIPTMTNAVTAVETTTLPETVTTVFEIDLKENLSSMTIETPKMNNEVTFSGTVIDNGYSQIHEFIPTRTGYYGIEYSCGEDTEKCSLSGSNNKFEYGWELYIKNKTTVYLTKDEPYYFRFWNQSDVGYSYELFIYTPNDIIDMNGKAKGTFHFFDQHEMYIFIPSESGRYDFSVSKKTYSKSNKLFASIAEINTYGELKVPCGRISLNSYYNSGNEKVRLEEGKKYQITIYCRNYRRETDVNFEIMVNKLD